MIDSTEIPAVDGIESMSFIQAWPTLVVILITVVLLTIWFFSDFFKEKLTKDQPIFNFGIVMTVLSFLLFTLNEIFVLVEFKRFEGALLAFLFGFLSFIFEYHYRYREVNSKYFDLKESTDINSEIERITKPKIIGDYWKHLRRNSLNSVKNLVSGLTTTGYKGETVEKIKLLEQILSYIDESDEEGGIKSFKATTLNKPSEMWIKYDRLWAMQKDLMGKIDDVKDKKRYVVLNAHDLHHEIESESEKLQDFIGWHLDNDFDLKFLLEDGEDFKRQISEYANISEKNILNDFAIIESDSGNKYLYGEEIESGLIRLINGYQEESEVVNEFSNFFERLSDKKINRHTFPERSAKQILAECERILDKQNFSLNQIYDHYDEYLLVGGKSSKVRKLNKNLEKQLNENYNHILQLVVEKKNISGDNYIRLLSVLFENVAQDSELIALDLTPTKMRFLDWYLDSNYNEWMQRTINAAQKKCTCSRVFIINRIEHDDGTLDAIVSKVLLPQLKVGINLYSVSEYELFEYDLAYHDFLLIKDKLCHSLNISQTFVNEIEENAGNTENSIISNLEHPDCFDRYENTYNNIVNNDKLNSIMQLEFKDKDKLKEDLERFYDKNLFNYEQLRNKNENA